MRNSSGDAGNPLDVAHLPGSDKFMFVDDQEDVMIADFSGNLVRQYDAGLLGLADAQGLAVNPDTCDHVFGDKNLDKIVSLNVLAAADLTLAAEADSYLKADKANDNYGGNSPLQLKDTNNKEKQVVLRFDLTTAPGTIDSATLRLYVTDNRLDNTANVQAYALTEAWDEADVTWNYRTASDSWTDGGGTYITPPVSTVALPKTLENDWFEIDITNLVQDWIDGDITNHGLILLSDQGKDVKFVSRENASSLHPKLILTIP